MKDVYFTSRYGARRDDPAIYDFTSGNSPQMPRQGLVGALRERATHKDKGCFTDKTSE